MARELQGIVKKMFMNTVKNVSFEELGFALAPCSEDVRVCSILPHYFFYC